MWFVGYISVHDVYLFTIEALHTKLEGVILHYVYVSKESLLNFTGVVYSLLLKVSCFAWLEKKQKKFTKIYFLRFFMVSLIHFQFLLFFLFSLCYYSCFCKFKVCFLHCVKSVTIRGFSGHIFLDSDWIRRDTEYVSVFRPNAGKWEPEKLQIQTFLRCVNATQVSCPVIIKGMIKGIL